MIVDLEQSEQVLYARVFTSASNTFKSAKFVVDCIARESERAINTNLDRTINHAVGAALEYRQRDTENLLDQVSRRGSRTRRAAAATAAR